jgi:hypothetical protein
MLTTRVTVLDSKGHPYAGAGDRLSFLDLPLGGVTQPVQTDAQGVAVIEHRSQGTADVIVNGHRQGRYVLPANLTVELG